MCVSVHNINRAAVSAIDRVPRAREGCVSGAIIMLTIRAVCVRLAIFLGGCFFFLNEAKVNETAKNRLNRWYDPLMYMYIFEWASRLIYQIIIHASFFVCAYKYNTFVYIVRIWTKNIWRPIKNNETVSKRIYLYLYINICTSEKKALSESE